jgi:glucose-6-phosphate isomerase
MTRAGTIELASRIWARDAALWTSSGEERWLGWLDEPARMRERVGELEAFAEAVAADGLAGVVLLGMGGASLAPEVIRRAVRCTRFHVLDTTHPAAIVDLEESIDPEHTLFLVSSKSGTTLETRCLLDYFWARTGERGAQFAAITDPGTELERLARDRGFRAVFAGEPEIGGRYSALSVFGLVPAALMEVELDGLLERAVETAEDCKGEDENPGLELGLQLGNGWREGRDKVVVAPNPGGFGLWVEQLLAESTGKDGRGLVPAPTEPGEGADRQVVRPRIVEPADLGAELFRFEFATAVAGALMEVNPFDQPNVQEAKDRTEAILAGAEQPPVEPVGSLDELLSQARPRDYFCVQAFVAPSPKADAGIALLRDRVRAEAGIVTTAGYGPRYLHSTGQLHKGGPPTGLFLQLVDDPDPLEIPGRPFGFHRLLHAQAAGDFGALQERGLRVARIPWGDL